MGSRANTIATITYGVVNDDDDSSAVFDDNVGVVVVKDVNSTDVETATDADYDDTVAAFDDNVGVADVNDCIPIDPDITAVEFTISKVANVSTSFSNTTTGLSVIFAIYFLDLHQSI